MHREISKNTAPKKPDADHLDRQTAIPMPELRPPHDATGMTDPEIAHWCLAHGAGRLSRSERGSLYSLSRLTDPLTSKQREWLADLHKRISRRT